METELCVCVILCVLVFNAAVKYQTNVSVQTYSVIQVWVNNALSLFLSLLIKHIEPFLLILLLGPNIRNKYYFLHNREVKD